MNPTVAVVGLGYVGLPLAVAFGKRFQTLGYDIAARRVEELARGLDRSGEVSGDELREAMRLRFSNDPGALRSADFIIVAVPTPIDAARQPDLGALIGASRAVG